jgi:hypothetical protein
MAGAASTHDARAAAAGARIEAEARAAWPSDGEPVELEHPARLTLLGRLKAALAA